MSRFVSAGTDADSRPPLTDDAWAQARQEVEARQQSKSTSQNKDSGKSLYEVLEQNKGRLFVTANVSCSLSLWSINCVKRSRQAGSL